MDTDRLKRVLSAQFRAFTDQTEALQRLRLTHRAQCRSVESLGDVRKKWAGLLPQEDPSEFELALLPLLGKRRGIKRECAAQVLALFQTIPSKTDMSTVQREQIALACAVLRSSDGNASELMSFFSQGGGVLLCKWLVLATEHGDYSLADHAMQCIGDAQLDALVKSKQMELVRKFSDSLESCQRRIAREPAAVDTSSSLASTIAPAGPPTNQFLGYWLSNVDNQSDKKAALRRCALLQSKCAAVLRGGAASKPREPKKQRTDLGLPTGPKPIMERPLPVKPAHIKAKPAARSALSVQSILISGVSSGNSPGISSGISSAISSSISAPSSAVVSKAPREVMSISTVGPAYFDPPPEEPSEFSSFSFVAMASNKRKAGAGSKRVHWTDCSFEDGREPGPLSEVRVYTVSEEEHTAMHVGMATEATDGDVEDEAEKDGKEGRLEPEKELSRERKHLEAHKLLRIPVVTAMWSTPGLVWREGQGPGQLDSKEYTAQTLRLAKHGAIMTGAPAGQKRSSAVPSARDPEAPPKESHEDRRKQGQRYRFTHNFAAF